MNIIKTIAITGSSKGLGAAIAKEYCKNKYYYWGLSRWNEIDVRNYMEIEKYLKGIECCPEIFCNNAAVCIPGNIFQQDIFQAEEQIRTNFLGVYYCCKIYVQLCQQYGIKGKIVNIASTAGTGSRPGRSIYAATKAALINFSLSLSEELKDYGIKVYIICPAAFDSDMRRVIEPDDDFENMMKPDEVAQQIYKIVDNDYLDGQVIYIKK